MNKFCILNTRPVKQANELEKILINSDYKTIFYPTIKIIPLKNNNLIMQDVDYLIFTSINSVIYGLPTFKNIDINNKKNIAIGLKTAQYLLDKNIKLFYYPKTNITSSDNLLNVESIKSITNKKIVIIRGRLGVNKLRDFLIKKNKVSYHIVYDQQNILFDKLAKKKLINFLLIEKRIVIFTSIISLQNLYQQVLQIGNKFLEKLKQSFVVVFSERIAENAVKMGFIKKIVIVEKMNNEGILKAIQYINRL